MEMERKLRFFSVSDFEKESYVVKGQLDLSWMHSFLAHFVVGKVVHLDHEEDLG